MYSEAKKTSNNRQKTGVDLGIEPPVFRGNTAITLIPQKTLRDPILPMFSLCLSDVGVWDPSFQ